MPEVIVKNKRLHLKRAEKIKSVQITFHRFFNIFKVAQKYSVKEVYRFIEKSIIFTEFSMKFERKICENERFFYYWKESITEYMIYDIFKLFSQNISLNLFVIYKDFLRLFQI